MLSDLHLIKGKLFIFKLNFSSYRLRCYSKNHARLHSWKSKPTYGLRRMGGKENRRSWVMKTWMIWERERRKQRHKVPRSCINKDWWPRDASAHQGISPLERGWAKQVCSLQKCNSNAFHQSQALFENPRWQHPCQAVLPSVCCAPIPYGGVD